MTTKKRLAAYGMAATAAIGGGIGGLAIGLGLGGEPASIATQLAAASTDGSHPGQPGRGCGPRGAIHVDRKAIAAQVLGISADELRTARDAGKSLNQIAKDRNIDPQKLVDALTAAENTALDQAVKDGRLTQAQADEHKAKQADRIKADLDRVHTPGDGGPGPGHGPRGRGPGHPAGFQMDPGETAATPAAVVVN